MALPLWQKKTGNNWHEKQNYALGCDSAMEKKKEVEKVARDWVGVGDCNFDRVLGGVLFEKVTLKQGLEGSEEIGQVVTWGRAFQPQGETAEAYRWDSVS